jgi:excisionase family DNA binding protein
VEASEVITTGTAARVLGSSRQHVVDLCERGALPYTTVGRHRRLLRSDVERLAHGGAGRREDLRSLWLAYATAGQIVADPSRAMQLAAANLARMREAQPRASKWLDEWSRLLAGPISEVLATLTSPAPMARELRANSPFAGLLPEDERLRVLESFREVERDS